MRLRWYVPAGLTVPGVMLHEFAHQAMCWFTGTRVREVCYFRRGDPAGYVIHDAPASAWAQMVITLGPFLVNTGVALVAGAFAWGAFWTSAQAVWLRPVLGWLACAAARHAFPSTGDAQSLWRALWGRRGAGWLARLVGTPLVGVLYVGAWGAWLWLDVAYAVLCGAVLPWWLTHGR